MDHFEMVEKLAQKTGATYEEAKLALEKCDWDMLDALVMLENNGTVKPSPDSAAQYSTQPQPQPIPAGNSGSHKAEFVSGMQKLWNFLCRLLQKGNANAFTIFRGGEELVTMPVTVLVLLMILVWPLSMILLVVGLFTGMRYKFSGPDLGENNTVNKMMDQAADLYHNQNDQNNEKE